MVRGLKQSDLEKILESVKYSLCCGSLDWGSKSCTHFTAWNSVSLLTNRKGESRLSSCRVNESTVPMALCSSAFTKHTCATVPLSWFYPPSDPFLFFVFTSIGNGPLYLNALTFLSACIIYVFTMQDVLLPSGS